jgi:DNA-directed RNA polymerase specialized sigma24 family protein
MSSDGSVTRWLGQLQEGDEAAVQPLWERYFGRLVGLARTKLRATPCRAFDGEDVAISAFDSFCRNAERGRFPLVDRDSLWRLLVVITVRKAANLLRHEGRQKCGGGHAAVPGASAEGEGQLFEQALSREPSPELAAELAEQYQLLLDRLDDPELEQVALWRMEGYSVEEIARKKKYAPRTIKRKLQLIRDLWEREGQT